MSAEAPRPPGRLARLRDKVRVAPMRAAGFSLALLVGFGLVFLVTAVEVTSTPRFCGSCHIMKPYYESWRHSKHKNIACVDCHIPPGVTAEIRKKYEALSMVARYFTGTYGTNPWTEIDDAACLRCHERRLLMGKERIGDIQFDHSSHLSEMRRGKTLRCTSCHSQIVQGSHMAVTTSTCILCHFKGRTPGVGTARCTLCHQVPTKTVKVGDVSFNHSDVVRFGMNCQSCHGMPAGSDGRVPKERCITCHNQTARLEKYSDTDLLHRKHVTEHKVDCMYCHLEIQHVEPVKAEAAVARIQTAATQCQSCHESGGHSPQLALYTGTGGRGVKPMPSVMYQAGVRCEGCHFSLPGHEAAVDRASDISCMSCHGAGYRKIYLSWTEGSARRADGLRREMDETMRAIGAAGSPQLEDARFNLSLVEHGRGVHNVGYAFALLGKAHQDMNAARRARGLAPLPTPWKEPAYESPCLTCHEGIEGQIGEIFGKRYAHEPHVVVAKLRCESCHRPHAEKPQGEIVRFGEDACQSCHHSAANVATADKCVTCHAGIRKGTVKSFRGDFDHDMHIDETEKTCIECHDMKGPAPVLQKKVCAECHDD
ncbi:MAG TPA: cytochrome c3 family protein [Candidatus Eisenbacteria bacterium]